MSVSPTAYRRIVLGAGIMLGIIIVSGSAVRLTSSGLGCEDWPRCTEDSFAPEWNFHGWVEFGNRLFTGVVSAAVILAVLAAYIRVPRNRHLITLAWGLVAGVIAQIIVGKYVVELGLAPISVTVHFMLSMVLLANAVVLYRAADPATETGAKWSRPAPRSASSAVHLLLGLAVLVTGTIVTGTGPNSGDSRADRLPFDLETVARVHSLTVWAFVALTLWVGWETNRRGGPLRAVQFLLSAIAVQGAIGYAQYFLGVPPSLVQLHIIGSIAVWCATVWLFLDGARPVPDHHRGPALRNHSNMKSVAA